MAAPSSIPSRSPIPSNFASRTDMQSDIARKKTQPVFVRGSKSTPEANAVPSNQDKGWLNNLVHGKKEPTPIGAQNARMSNNIQQLFVQMKENGPSGKRSVNFEINGLPAAINGTSHHQMINSRNLQVEIKNGVPRINCGVKGDMALGSVLFAAQAALQRHVGS